MRAPSRRVCAASRAPLDRWASRSSTEPRRSTMAKHGKKYRAIAEKVDRSKRYSIEEACRLVRELKVAKFDESVDVAINLGVDPRHADQMVRGAVVLPHGTGKSVRVAVFAKGEKAKEAEAAGADI